MKSPRFIVFAPTLLFSGALLFGSPAFAADARLPTAEPGRETASSAPPAAIDWPADLARFQRELPARHPNLFFSLERAGFERQLAQLREDLPQLSPLATTLRLQEIAVALGDDHTGVDWTQFAAREPAIPLGIHWFRDGWRVLSIQPEQSALLGRKLVAIGGVPMPEVEKRFARILSRDNPWLVKHRMSRFVGIAGVLAFLQLATSSEVVYTTLGEEGQPLDTRLAYLPRAAAGAVRRAEFQPARMPYGWANQRPILRGKLLAQDRILYVHYNRCEGRGVAERRGDTAAAARLPSLAEGFARMTTEIRSALAADQADKLVIDLQFNPGGASDFGTRFAEELATIETLREPGRVFVIIGRRTFSSAIINALDFKQQLGAVLVGEPASGTPNHFGEVREFTLPSSGLRVFCSTKRFGETNGPFEPLRPDVVAEMSFSDYAAGIDPALEAIKRQPVGITSPAGR